jgi:hypothetical protein
LILLDADPEVVRIASQPFWLHWHDGRRKQCHAPEYFVRLADGRCRVVDVRAGDRIDEAAAESFAASHQDVAARLLEVFHERSAAGRGHRGG